MVAAVEITAIHMELRAVRRVKVEQIGQRVHTIIFFGFAFPEIEMKMGIGRVFLTHRADHVALMHLCASNHTLRDAVKMHIDKEQVMLFVRRITALEKDMR